MPAFTPLSKLPHFDPRRVPSLGTDAHLPAIGPQLLTPEALLHRFHAPPAWQPEVIFEKRFSDRAEMRAAVLMALVMRGPARDELTVLLTERAAHMNTHSGQVAFPGGKVDEGDADVAATALREAKEEVDLDAGFIEVIGRMPLYTTGTAFTVTPVVALVRPGFQLRANPSEVADVFEVPLAFLMNPANHHRHVFEWTSEAGPERREWFSMTYADAHGERFIWGATAAMLRNFYRFLAA
ncbi:CoA pyrophosphatase [Rhodoferax koreense]|uniref:CoA pyrophosphatase n=1 Tax=Rhodoferax koreensis TaxID=1842727 RepID=A0A1P8K3N9_9BURK|nr:CoA pyrophosphatase [Rhodoferax koreense]